MKEPLIDNSNSESAETAAHARRKSAAMKMTKEGSNEIGKPHPLSQKDLVGARDLPEGLKSLPGGKIYASTGPRIMLEIITARTAAIIIALTWVVFIICFSIDFYLTYKSFHSSNYVLNSFDCSSYNLTETDILPHFSCGNSATASWNATVRELSNVISFSMDVQQTNITSLLANRTSDSFNVNYNLQVWTCYNEEGCGEHFDYSDTYTQDGNVWQKVLILQDALIEVNLDTDLVNDGNGDKKLNLQLITNTFQNQESIPTNGLVKSYFVVLEYTNNPYGLFSSSNEVQQTDTTYNFHVVRAPGNRVLQGINVILLFVTVVVLCLYCYILYRNIGSFSKWKHALSEQKWVVMYFLLVILFQNPVYCVIGWYTTQPPVTAAYATFLMNYIAQSGLFTLWLLFAHSYQRKLQRKTFFYGPKVFIGVAIFVFGVFILTYQFPSLALPRTNRSAVQAVENWSNNLQLSFVICTIIYLVLIMFWTVAWFVRLVLTGRMMNRLPYMSTRYMQLSFRFFSLQATLVTIYYIAQYALVAFFISRDTTTGYATTLTTIADNINVLFRQQFQLFGKTFFLTTYAMILAFMFLPPDLLDSSGFYTTIAATYAVSEEEHKEVVKGRRHALKNVKRNLINQVTRYDQLIRAKEDIFCVDLALKLRNVAFQSYYDRPDGAQTASSFGKTQDLDSVGYDLIEEFYDPTHEVYCIIAREKEVDSGSTPRIIVSFRGTASKRQMEDNMNYSQRPVDFQNLDIPSLDHLDRLNVPTNDEIADIELESVEGEDEATPLAAVSPTLLQRLLLQRDLLLNPLTNTITSAANNNAASGNTATTNMWGGGASSSSFFRGPSLSLFGNNTTTAAAGVHRMSNAQTAPPLAASTVFFASSTGNNTNNNSVNDNFIQTNKEQEHAAMLTLGIRLPADPSNNILTNNNNNGKDGSISGNNSQSNSRQNSFNGQSNNSHHHHLDLEASMSYKSAKSATNLSNNNNNNNNEDSANNAREAHGILMGRETIMERAGQVGGNITNFLSDAVGATNQGIDLVVGATTGVVTTAAKITPGLKKFVTPNVHVGFYEAYTVVRGFIHGVLRAELMKTPTTVIFTGHSLGGALATFAALDFKLTSLPRINAYLKYQAKKQLMKMQQMDLENTSGTNHYALKMALFPNAPFQQHNNSNSNNEENGGLLDDEDDEIEHHGSIASTASHHTLSPRKLKTSASQKNFLQRFNPTKLFSTNNNTTANTATTTNNNNNNNAHFNASSPSESFDHTPYQYAPHHHPSIVPVQSPPNSPPPADNNTNTAANTWGQFLSTQSTQALRHTNSNFNNNNSNNKRELSSFVVEQHQAVFVKPIDVVMYNFGSPRVGNFAFKQLYDKEIPRSYRVVVDGDVVPGLPPSGYAHIGTEILIDSLGVGTIIIDPSFVERWLRTHLKSSISVHSLLIYRKGLLGVKLSAEALRDYANEKTNEYVDPTRLALAWRNRVQIEKIVETETAEADSTHNNNKDSNVDNGSTTRRSSLFDSLTNVVVQTTNSMRRSSFNNTSSSSSGTGGGGAAAEHSPATAAAAAAASTNNDNDRTAADNDDNNDNSRNSKAAFAAAAAEDKPLPWSLRITHPSGQLAAEDEHAADLQDTQYSPLASLAANHNHSNNASNKNTNPSTNTNVSPVVGNSSGSNNSGSNSSNVISTERKVSDTSIHSDEGILLRPVPTMSTTNAQSRSQKNSSRRTYNNGSSSDSEEEDEAVKQQQQQGDELSVRKSETVFVASSPPTSRSNLHGNVVVGSTSTKYGSGSSPNHLRNSYESESANNLVVVAHEEEEEAVVAESEEAKKARLRRMLIMQGAQDEEYYDHTEKDYVAMMGQIRSLKAKQWQLKVKMVPAFLRMPKKTAAAAATANSSNSNSGSTSNNNYGEYVPPVIPESQETHK